MAEFFIEKNKDGYLKKQYQPTYDPNCEETEWFHTFSILPRTCEVTGDSLFFKPAYCFKRQITGYDMHEVEYHWHSERGHVLYLLQKEVK